MPGTIVAIIVILIFTAVTMLAMRQESRRYQTKQPRPHVGEERREKE